MWVVEENKPLLPADFSVADGRGFLLKIYYHKLGRVEEP